MMSVLCLRLSRDDFVPYPSQFIAKGMIVLDGIKAWSVVSKPSQNRHVNRSSSLTKQVHNVYAIGEI
jgi:hypothetical protein